jgi:hypothetical protein
VKGSSAMIDQAAYSTLEGIRAKIDVLLDALVTDRDDETVQHLQTLVSLESKIDEDPEPPAGFNWF